MDALERLGKEIMPFGKYGPEKDANGLVKKQGYTFDKIPLTYLDWMLGQDWLKEPLKSKIKTYLSHPTIERELEKERRKPRTQSIRIGHAPEKKWTGYRKRHF